MNGVPSAIRDVRITVRTERVELKKIVHVNTLARVIDVARSATGQRRT